MERREMGSKEGGGLSRVRMDLVNRYLADAHGPPPRAPLRFWIGGEWVEVASSEAERRPEVGPTLAPTPRPSPVNLRPDASGASTTSVRLGLDDDASRTASKLRAYGRREDDSLVRDKIAKLRAQRNAGELGETDFATHVAALLNGAMAARRAFEGPPNS
jgi:hypothetical protein